MLKDLLQAHFLAFFPVLFIGMWLAITTFLGLLSGWFSLASKYPDRNEQPILRMRHQSGTMGLVVGMNGVLSLSACPSGLRVGIFRIFGPFSRDFFVPWQDLTVTRKKVWFRTTAELGFGNPRVGKLQIPTEAADRLARAAVGSWPETGPIPVPERGELARSLLKQWAAMTTFAALFFTLAPRLLTSNRDNPPILVAILFPAIAFGVIFIVKFFRGIRP